MKQMATRKKKREFHVAAAQIGPIMGREMLSEEASNQLAQPRGGGEGYGPNGAFGS